MAVYDWNHNGKKDMQDDYLEYQIYKKSTENNNNYSGGGDSGCIMWVLIILFILSLLSQCS